MSVFDFGPAIADLTPHYSVLNRVSAGTYKSKYKSSTVVVDIGSYWTRAGYAEDSEPRMVFRTQVSKPRTKKNGETDIAVGDALTVVEYQRAVLKSPFDGQLASHFSLMETILDYAFEGLGILKPQTHNIVMTEPLANPSYCRKHMNHLLLEQYGFKSVSYGIDSLLSRSHNSSKQPSGLVVHVSHGACTVIPVHNGVPLRGLSCRLDIGAQDCKDFFQVLLKSINPTHRLVLNDIGAQMLFHKFTRFSADYKAELQSPVNDAITVQLDFEQTVAPSEEELESRRQGRKELGKRLQEMAKERRAKKLEQQKELLGSYQRLLSEKESGNITLTEFIREIKKGGFEDEKDFDAVYKELVKTIDRLEGNDDEEEQGVCETSYPLVDIPDSELTDEQIKEKRYQKLMKGSADARARKREEKEAIMHAEEVLKEQQREAFEKDPTAFVSQMLSKRQAVLVKRRKRLKHKHDLSNRRSGAVKQRMHMLTKMGTGQVEESDTFGAEDDDWNIYRVTSLDTSHMDSESEEEKQEINKIEDLLTDLDPNVYLPGESEESRPKTIEELHQFQISRERIRATELIFQPSMVGNRQSGLGEVINIVAQRLPRDAREDILSDVFISGGLAHVPGISERIYNECRVIVPYGLEFSVRTAADPTLDSWKGAAGLAKLQDIERLEVTTESLIEHGEDYVVEHELGNLHIPKPQQGSKKRKR